jgi:hypothetical protein
MNGPDARAGQHGDDQFRNHGHVQGHVVALADMQGAQGVGHAADFGVQHLIGVAAHVHFIFALPDQGGLVAAA